MQRTGFRRVGVPAVLCTATAGLMLGALAAPAAQADDGESSGPVKIYNKGSGGYLGVYDDNPNENHEVRSLVGGRYWSAEEHPGRAAHDWVVTRVGDYHTLRLTKTKDAKPLCLTAKSGAVMNSAIILSPCQDGRASQQWSLKAPESGEGDWLSIRPRNGQDMAIGTFKREEHWGAYDKLSLNRANESSDRLWKVPGVSDESAPGQAEIKGEPNQTARNDSFAKPAVTVTNTGRSRIAKRTVTLTPGPAGVSFPGVVELRVKRPDGTSQTVRCTDTGTKAVCNDVPLGIGPGQTTRLDTDVRISGLKQGEIPSLGYDVDRLGRAKSEMRVVG
ncbi:RICIN domain-containing protein [Streptomyces marispadix]|nr:RICIN domain-containing protein [Streptomyces marispadix]